MSDGGEEALVFGFTNPLMARSILRMGGKGFKVIAIMGLNEVNIYSPTEEELESLLGSASKQYAEGIEVTIAIAANTEDLPSSESYRENFARSFNRYISKIKRQNGEGLPDALTALEGFEIQLDRPGEEEYWVNIVMPIIEIAEMYVREDMIRSLIEHEIESDASNDADEEIEE